MKSEYNRRITKAASKEKRPVRARVFEMARERMVSGLLKMSATQENGDGVRGEDILFHRVSVLVKK